MIVRRETDKNEGGGGRGQGMEYETETKRQGSKEQRDRLLKVWTASSLYLEGSFNNEVFGTFCKIQNRQAERE
jgi:hypothetical protein